MPFCTTCANPYHDDQQFCAHCGQPLISGQDQNAGATPQGTFASWGDRAIGLLLDQTLVVLPSLVVASWSQEFFNVALIALELVLAYQLGTRGQTPGMRIVGIACLNADTGEVLGFGAAVVRAIAHALDDLIFLLGWLWPLWDKRGQTLADKVVNSIVIKVAR